MGVIIQNYTINLNQRFVPLEDNRPHRRLHESETLSPRARARGRKIAFSVLVENGVYGGTAATPAAAEMVNAAVKLGLIQP